MPTSEPIAYQSSFNILNIRHRNLMAIAQEAIRISFANTFAEAEEILQTHTGVGNVIQHTINTMAQKEMVNMGISVVGDITQVASEKLGNPYTQETVNILKDLLHLGAFAFFYKQKKKWREETTRARLYMDKMAGMLTDSANSFTIIRDKLSKKREEKAADCLDSFLDICQEEFCERFMHAIIDIAQGGTNPGLDIQILAHHFALNILICFNEMSMQKAQKELSSPVAIRNWIRNQVVIREETNALNQFWNVVTKSDEDNAKLSYGKCVISIKTPPSKMKIKTTFTPEHKRWSVPGLFERAPIMTLDGTLYVHFVKADDDKSYKYPPQLWIKPDLQTDEQFLQSFESGYTSGRPMPREYQDLKMQSDFDTVYDNLRLITKEELLFEKYNETQQKRKGAEEYLKKNRLNMRPDSHERFILRQTVYGLRHQLIYTVKAQKSDDFQSVDFLLSVLIKYQQLYFQEIYLSYVVTKDPIPIWQAHYLAKEIFWLNYLFIHCETISENFKEKERGQLLALVADGKENMSALYNIKECCFFSFFLAQPFVPTENKPVPDGAIVSLLRIIPRLFASWAFGKTLQTSASSSLHQVLPLAYLQEELSNELGQVFKLGEDIQKKPRFEDYESNQLAMYHALGQLDDVLEKGSALVKSMDDFANQMHQIPIHESRVRETVQENYSQIGKMLQQLLFAAIIGIRPDLVERLLKQFPKNQTSLDEEISCTWDSINPLTGYTAIQTAALYGDTQTFQALFTNMQTDPQYAKKTLAADKYLSTNNGNVLHSASYGGNPLIMRALLEEDPNLRLKKDDRNCSPLHIAAASWSPYRYECVALLLSQFTDEKACKKAILEERRDVKADPENKYVLLIACSDHPDPDTIQVLLEKAGELGEDKKTECLHALNLTYKKLIAKMHEADLRQINKKSLQLRQQVNSCAQAIVRFILLTNKKAYHRCAADKLLSAIDHTTITYTTETLAHELFQVPGDAKGILDQLDDNYTISSRAFAATSAYVNDLDQLGNTRKKFQEQRIIFFNKLKKTADIETISTPALSSPAISTPTSASSSASTSSPLSASGSTSSDLSYSDSIFRFPIVMFRFSKDKPVEPNMSRFHLISETGEFNTADAKILEEYLNAAVCFYHTLLPFPIAKKESWAKELCGIPETMLWLNNCLAEMEVDSVNVSDDQAKFKEKINHWLAVLEAQLKYYLLGYSLQQPISNSGYQLVSVKDLYSTGDSHFVRKPVDTNSQGYLKEFLGADRKKAYDILIKADFDRIQGLITPAVKVQMKEDDNFLEYLRSLPEILHIPRGVENIRNYMQLSKKERDVPENQTPLFIIAANPIVIKAYIRYDVLESKVDGGWTSPHVLKALAILNNKKLRIFQLGVGFNLLDDKEYNSHADIAPKVSSNSKQQKEYNLLLTVGHRFDILDANQTWWSDLQNKYLTVVDELLQDLQLKLTSYPSFRVAIVKVKDALETLRPLLMNQVTVRTPYISPSLIEHCCHVAFADTDKLLKKLEGQPTNAPALILSPNVLSMA